MYMYTLDYTCRPLTVAGDTNADKANEIWYRKMTPVQRYEVLIKVRELSERKMSELKTFRACLNYVADHLENYL